MTFCCVNSQTFLRFSLKITNFTGKSHSVGSVTDNHKVLVKFGVGMKEDNHIKYIKCNICGCQKEDTGFNITTHNYQSYHEMEEHVKTEHKEAFDDKVLEWHDGFIRWKNRFN